MAALQDYIDLRLAVSEHVDRRDISDVITRMTLAAEAWLNKKLRCREMVTTGATLTFSSGLAPLPDDFLEVITLWDATNGYPLTGGPQTILQESQNAYSYSIYGGNFYLYGADGAARLLDYYAALPTLTTSPTTSNWLLQKAPNVYLYAVSFEVLKWLKNVELAGATDELLQREMSALRSQDAYERYGGATTRVRSAGP